MAITMDMRGPGGRPAPARVAAPAAAGRDRAFSVARRHSRLVKTLRLAMPLGGAAAVLLYGFFLTASWKWGPGRLNPGKIEVTADDLTMKNPSYFGVTKDGGSYEVRAQKAVLDFNRKAPIKLFGVDGDLLQSNNVKTRLKAKHGLLDNAKNELELYDNVEIDASNGLAARLSRATVYSKEHRVVSKEPVQATMPTGAVKSAAMTFKTDTREANFAGNVEVRLTQTAGRTTPGFGRDARQPVDVNADHLVINDTNKTALFTGGVVATQGDSTLKAPELHIKYEGKAVGQSPESVPSQPGADSSRLSLLSARNGVIMTAGSDRRVASDQADFDAKVDTALFTGNVLVNQGKNVLQGRRLFVDRKAAKSRLESPADAGQPAGRIAATFYQNEAKPGAPAKTKAPAAQAAESALGMLGTFKTDPTAPMDVEADTLDVNDNAKTAVFRGNVKSQQGDFVVRTVELTAIYTGQTGLGLAGPGSTPDAAAAGGGAGAQLTRIEARQKVLVSSKDGQSATGDWAIFDVRGNSVLMGGHVVVTRAKDVVEGPRLKIDLTTGMYRFEVEGDAPVAAAPAVSAAPPAAASAPTGATAEHPTGRACPPGKQCLLFYPKEAKDKAKDAVKKIAPGLLPPKASEAWQPGTSASPVMRGQ